MQTRAMSLQPCWQRLSSQEILSQPSPMNLSTCSVNLYGPSLRASSGNLLSRAFLRNCVDDFLEESLFPLCGPSRHRFRISSYMPDLLSCPLVETSSQDFFSDLLPRSPSRRPLATSFADLLSGFLPPSQPLGISTHRMFSHVLPRRLSFQRPPLRLFEEDHVLGP